MSKLFLANGNFRNFLLFQTFRGIGSGIFSIFMMWMIHFEYQNPFYTGAVGFMFAFPFIASFIVGPFVDKRNKVTLIRIACFVQFIIAGLLLVIPYIFTPGIWFFLFAVFIFYTALVIDQPAETALLPMIVDGEDLIKANALINIVATAFGLGIGVFLYFSMDGNNGFQLVYAINAAVLLIALVFSALLRSPESKQSDVKADTAVFKTYFTELKAGLLFVRHGVVMFLIVFLVFMDIFASVAYVNLPMFAQVHTGQASGYIILTALAMVGGILGSYISRIVGAKLEVWKIFVACFILAGIARIVFVNVIAQDFSRALWIYILYIGLGSTIGMFFRTLMQKLPPKHMIARVNTITTSLFSVTSALGALLGGLLGTLIANVDTVFIIQGISYIVIGVCICLTGPIRKLPKIDDVTEVEIS